MNNIYLVGFMGTGKTAVGRELARRKGWNFIDLDDLIELKEKRRIADIFAKEGEPYFRRIEHEILKEVALGKDSVVACGGGIVIDPENIRIMKESGALICLSASPQVILERTRRAKHRPLLDVEDPQGRIDELLKARAPFYAKADHSIDTSKLSVEKIVEKILGIISGKQNEQI